MRELSRYLVRHQEASEISSDESHVVGPEFGRFLQRRFRGVNSLAALIRMEEHQTTIWRNHEAIFCH